MGGSAANGWRFWSLADGEQPTPVAAPAPKGKAAKVAKVFYRSPNQKGLAEGQTRYYCNACAAGFVADEAAFEGRSVDACPQGHRNDDAELTSPAAADGGE